MNPSPYSHRLVALGTLAAALVVLAWSAGPIPDIPGDPSTWPTWWSATDPALALAAVLRAGATVACTYLFLVTVLDLLATAVGSGSLTRVARRLAPPAWRAVVLRPVAAGALALPVLVSPIIGSPAGATTSTTTVPADDEQDAPVLTMTWAGPPSVTTSTAPPAPTTTAPAPLTTTTQPDDPPSAEAPEAPPPAPHTAELPMPASPPSPTAPLDAERRPVREGGAEHVVEPGESFWRIAERRLDAELGRAPTDHELGRYWRHLIAANEDRLPVPGNPDLIHPGMQLVLPEVDG